MKNLRWRMASPTRCVSHPLSGQSHIGQESPRGAILPVSYSVMPGLVPGIHVVLSMPDDVDGRDRPGHDDVETQGPPPLFITPSA